jgi:menaquinone-dependent protoporphyrinogen oxidase
MPNILIVYSSTHGHTRKIAERIAATVREEGAEAELVQAANPADVEPADYDAVIVGASIHASHHQREAVDWAKHHAGTLNEMPSAFFSVCLAAAEEDEESRAHATKYVEDFVDETGWSPRAKASFAGALQYLEYNFPTRLLIRLMMKRAGHPTDTSRDYDYTDWDAVERFAHECAGMVAGAAAR